MTATLATTLDDLSTPALWRAQGSDGVVANLESLQVEGRPFLRLNFDFQHHAGYALVDRPLPLDLPENFDLDVQLGGEAKVNELQVKFIDASGDNVWWYRVPNFEFHRGLQHLRIRRRQIEFAWGPTADRRLRHVERLQFVVNAGQGGGAGVLDIGPVVLTPQPVPPAVWPQATASAEGAPVPLPDGTADRAWRCRPRPGGPCDLIIDWQTPREFGGLRLDWNPERRAAAYELAVSADGENWRVVRRIRQGGGATDRHWLPESEARYVRLRLGDATADVVELRALTLEDIAFGASRNAMIVSAARAAPRGQYPRGFTEQAFWTVVGTDGGHHSGLLSEDGALETDRGGISVEPFVAEDGRLLGWADVTASQSLPDGYLPVPEVSWRSAHWSLSIGALAVADGLYGRYQLRNLGDDQRHLRLVLAIRPFQVNPVAQFLTTPGGVTPIRELAWSGSTLRANDAISIVPLTAPGRVALFPFESGAVPAALAGPDWGTPPATPLALHDEAELASAALAFEIELAPQESRTFGLFVPWGQAVLPDGMAGLAKAELATRSHWRERLGRAQILAPDSAEVQDVANALRTAAAHLLILREGPMLRPGTRSYARSWIRDGAMMSAGLLRLGETRAPEEYLRWYAGFLFADGKVPCCVDARGADPVPEHDSAGEFLFLAAEIYRLGGDRQLVAGLWPQLRAAAAYLERLRQSTRIISDGSAGSAPYYGMLPPSISHEGYSAKPMHSYWDDFWALRGYADAVFLARALGHPEDAVVFEAQRREFAADVTASLLRTARDHAIDFIPGAADLGDFDATSTTIALSPGAGAIDLPPGQLQNTFERYWREFVARRDGTRDWQDYTPYEWRNVGAFVRLGWRERAYAALQYFMADRRPPGWNQWPEVIGRERRTSRFIGDLPHGWVASDFIRSSLDVFAYEREADQAIVLAAGVPSPWLEGRGITVSGIRTSFGAVGYHLQHGRHGLDLELPPGLRVPPGGFQFSIPTASPDGVAVVDGRRVPFSGRLLTLRTVPCRVQIPD